MQPGDRGDEMIVTTPELVAFGYDIAGLGSRFLAQLIDLVLLGMVILVFTIVVAIAGAFGGNTAVTIAYVVGSFAIVVLYFPISEGLTSGQTLGKRAVRLRVVGDRGEPVTTTQVAIRNLIRIADFLPFGYAIGIITLFVQGGAKRLGDFAAGTVVVRERDRIRLGDLVKASRPSPLVGAGESAPRASIWADRAAEPQPPGAPPEAAAAIPVVALATPYEDAARRMSPELRRFITAYAARRNQLTAARREQLAAPVLGALAQLLPREVAAYGGLAVLEGLATLVYSSNPSPPPAV